MGIKSNILERIIPDSTLPMRPKGPASGDEYEFPTDPTELGSDAVGKWMFRLTAWQGYALRQLALADLTVADAKSVYEALLRTTVGGMEPKRYQNQTVLLAEAFKDTPVLQRMKDRLDEAEAEAGVWKQFHRIYEAQAAVLSREISRRASMEAREG